MRKSVKDCHITSGTTQQCKFISPGCSRSTTSAAHTHDQVDIRNTMRSLLSTPIFSAVSPFHRVIRPPSSALSATAQRRNSDTLFPKRACQLWPARCCACCEHLSQVAVIVIGQRRKVDAQHMLQYSDAACNLSCQCTPCFVVDGCTSEYGSPHATNRNKRMSSAQSRALRLLV